jgi:hypothetical protein
MNKSVEHVEFKVTGPKGRGAARFGDFLRLGESLRSSLHEVARCIAPDLARLEFEIIDLKFSSAFASIRPIIGIPDIPTVNDVILVHRQTIQQLQTGKTVDRRLDFPALESFRPFVVPLKGKHPPRVEVCGISLSLEFESNLGRMIEPDTTEFGEIRGQMEAVNLHRSNRFILYCEYDASKIICYFPEQLFERVKEGLGKRVNVSGLLSFKQGIPVPRRVDVENVSICNIPESPPSLLKMRGKLKGKLKKPSQELIRSLREEWDEA